MLRRKGLLFSSFIFTCLETIHWCHLLRLSSQRLRARATMLQWSVLYYQPFSAPVSLPVRKPASSRVPDLECRSSHRPIGLNSDVQTRLSHEGLTSVLPDPGAFLDHSS